MSTVRQAIIYSSISRYCIRVFGLISTMVVARLLTPGEIGTFAVAGAIVMIMSEFRLLGAGSYLVREAEINEEKMRSALGLTILMSWGLGLVVFVCAPYVADFYELEPVKTIFWILSISFFLAPFISIPTALLTRTYQFKHLFYVNQVAAITGLTTTISLILLGYTYYALAWGYTMTIVAEFLMITLFRPKETPWLPSNNNLRPIASFGIFTSAANLFKKATVTVPDMVIGKMGTTTEVGIFSRGLGFIEFLSQSLVTGVNPVSLPYLSDTKRSGGDIAWAYIRASVLLGGLVAPVLAVAGLASYPTIRLFFGDQWDAAAPLAPVLAVWGILRSIHWFSNSLLTACGHEKIMATKEAVLFAFFLTGVLSAYPHGLMAVATIFVLGGAFDVLITSIVLWKVIRLSALQFALAWLPNIYVTAICVGTTLLISQFIDFRSSNFWLPILAIAIILPPVWFLSLKLVSHPLYTEISNMLKALFDKLRK